MLLDGNTCRRVEVPEADNANKQGRRRADVTVYVVLKIKRIIDGRVLTVKVSYLSAVQHSLEEDILNLEVTGLSFVIFI